MFDDHRIAVLKALAEPTRRRIISALVDSSLTVKVISERLDVPQYQVSKHLAVLRDATIVEMEADWRFHNYTIAAALQPGLKEPEPVLDFGWVTFSIPRFIRAD